MPPASKRPSPPARMVELLAAEKKRLIDEGRAPSTLSVCDFNAVWERCWEVIVLERGWAHATRLRRSMRQSQDETKEECCAAFLGKPTPFGVVATRLAEIAERCGVDLAPEQVGRALLASIVFVDLHQGDVERTDAAATAARQFMGLERSEIAA